MLTNVNMNTHNFYHYYHYYPVPTCWFEHWAWLSPRSMNGGTPHARAHVNVGGLSAPSKHSSLSDDLAKLFCFCVVALLFCVYCCLCV